MRCMSPNVAFNHIGTELCKRFAIGMLLVSTVMLAKADVVDCVDPIIGAPQLPRIELKLENARTFTILAKNLSKQNLYVKSVTLNGRVLKDFLLKHSDIVAGGEIVFEMTAVPHQ